MIGKNMDKAFMEAMEVYTALRPRYENIWRNL